MAVIYGQPGNEAGDQKVYEALKTLPSECIVYAQPKLVYKSEIRYPDYIIVNKKWGVIVLEVKDWVQIQNINRNGLDVFRQSIRKWEFESCPVDQARSSAILLQNMLAEDIDLRNHAGKIDFSYAYGVALPNIFGTVIQNCNHNWGEGSVLGLLDLTPDKITQKIASIPAPFRIVMTENQFRATCAIIDPINKLIDKETGQFKGVLDHVQESIAKEPVIPQFIETVQKQTNEKQLMNELFPAPDKRIQHLEQEIPAEIIELKSNMHVRLVRGFAGTGKTDILILRALYLAEQNPKLKILVTTFNRDLLYERLNPELKHKSQINVKTFDSLCSAIYKKRHEKWRQPQEAKGLLAWMSKNNESIDKWGSDFLADEFTWIKESGRVNREEYITKPRDGRGGANGKIFSKEQKSEIYNIFDQYQYELKENSSFDWADLHEKTSRYLDEGIDIDKKYDVILIDEAQHFAPCWMKIITHFLKEDGVLFLCDDPSQSVYRFFSWKQKGINVVGKTRWLKIPYRNTKQIFEAAFSLIKNDQFAMNQLTEDKSFNLPDIENTFIRNGPKPHVQVFNNIDDEELFIKLKIEELIEKKGLRPKDICIFHNKKFVLERYKNYNEKGINIKDATTQTGMEYSAIFIPQVQKLIDRSTEYDWLEDSSRQHLLIYMMMTRAKSFLFMTYQQKWPAVLNGLQDYVDWFKMEQGNKDIPF